MIRSTFFGFGTAMSAMNASQRALDVTGNNIANLNTSGYTRQRLDLYSIQAMGGADRYTVRNNYAVGGGVESGGISQLRDPFLDVRFRREAASVGEADAHLGFLNDITEIFDEVQMPKIQQAFADFRSQLNKYISQSNMPEIDSVVRSAAETLSRLFNQLNRQIDTVREEQETDLKEGSIADVNDILKRIGTLNQSIKESALFGAPALELKDERNALIDELSTYMDIEVRYEPDATMPSVDNVIISFATDPAMIPPLTKEQRILVNNNKVQSLSAEKNAKGDWVIHSSGANSDTATGLTLGGGDLSGLNPADSAAMEQGLKGVNEALNRINTLNQAITKGSLSTPPQDPAQIAAMKLERDGHLKTVSDAMGAGNIDVSYKPDAATGNEMVINLTAVTVPALTADQKLLVGNNKVQELGAKSVGGAWVFNTVPQARDVEFKGGSLKGTTDMLNKSGEFDTPPNTTRGVDYYKESLDVMAADFAKVFNDANRKWIPLDPPDPAQPDAGTWEERPLFESNETNPDGSRKPITAGNISISSGWLNGTYGLTASNKSPVEGDASGAVDNIHHMIALLDETREFKGANGETVFKGKFDQFLVNVGTTAGMEAKSTTAVASSHISVLSGIEDLRDGISAVSLDEEAVSLLRYQKSYAAAARLMTTLDEALDVVINKMGLVGR